MGSDDESGWVPKPVRSKNKPKTDTAVPQEVFRNPNTPNSQNSSYRGVDEQVYQNMIDKNNYNNNNNNTNKTNQYHVSLNGDRRIVTAVTLDELIKNIKLKYNLMPTQNIRINYWSEEYHEWLYLDFFPTEKTKLQVSIVDNNNNTNQGLKIKDEDELNQIIRTEIQKYLEQPLNFAKHMNSTLKYYVEKNNSEILNHFEQSVHYISKRYNQNHSSPSKEVLHIQQQQQEIIAKLHEETQDLQIENKKLRQQINELRKDFESIDTTFKSKPQNRKRGCEIM